MSDKSKETPDRITELKSRLAAAEQKLSLYEMILNRLDVGIHVIDKDEQTLVYNAMMGKLESQDPNNILNKPLLEAMPFLQPQDSTLLAVLHGGKPLKDRRQTYINAQGKQVATVNSTTPLSINGKVVGALEVAKDITFIQTLAEKIADLHQNLSARQRGVAPRPFTARFTFEDIIGESGSLKSAKIYAGRAARTSSNVLIFGETGTGKELFAQSLHNASPRRDRPFIAVNCAALPEQLLEGLLFGTTKGGFTGAVDRPGFFEQAQGGTILLDEVNSMNLDLQAKLLRVLQEQSVRRLGAMNEVPVDVRVIATINVDPYEAIARKRLREDLYYRLGVVTLRIPPLREHKDDLPLYINAFIQKYNAAMDVEVTGISPDMLKAFYHYAWPGNIRELQHAIEGAMNLILAEEQLQMQHLPALFRPVMEEMLKSSEKTAAKAGEPAKLLEHRDAVEKEMIVAALSAANGNITRAAESLGLTRQLLQYKLKKYKMK